MVALTDQDPRPVALVTGGVTGIGAATARRLSTAYRVAVCGRRTGPIDRVARLGPHRDVG